ncbi:erythronate-4-phosphate dehydrogenase [Spirochaetota bacterium]|nr:erythronate-4-phosphate dehydrogenase [Spirochaetota bacterium]
MINIAYDEKIPYIEEVIAQCSKQSQLPLSAHAFTGTDTPAEIIEKAQLATARVLIVRSVTKVHADLLLNSAVKIVITATAGVDHIDKNYLKKHHIALKTTHGSNANAVSEYVLAVFLAYLSARQKSLENNSEHFSIKHILRETSVAIIGCGNIGSRLYATFEQLGVNVIGYDPPLLKKALAHQSHHAKLERYSSLAEVHGADFITFHVPLTHTGQNATYHMCDERFLTALRKKPWIVNTARGGVVDEIASIAALKRGLIGGIVLDVWEGEPKINLAVLNKTIFATPHIAGYSKEASLRTAKKIFDHLLACVKDDRFLPMTQKSGNQSSPSLTARFHPPQSEQIKPQKLSNLSLWNPVTMQLERDVGCPLDCEDDDSLINWLVNFCLQSSAVPALTSELKKYHATNPQTNKSSKTNLSEIINPFQRLRQAMRQRHEWSTLSLLASLDENSAHPLTTKTRCIIKALGFK